MLLSARPLKNVASANVFEYANTFEWTSGDTVTVFFQLIDAQLDRPEDGFVPPGRRFMPAVGSTLTVTLQTLDQLKQIAGRVATQPFPLDPSIWSFNVLASDLCTGTANLRLSLNQGGIITQGVLKNAFRVQSTTTI